MLYLGVWIRWSGQVRWHLQGQAINTGRGWSQEGRKTYGETDKCLCKHIKYWAWEIWSKERKLWGWKEGETVGLDVDRKLRGLLTGGEVYFQDGWWTGYHGVGQSWLRIGSQQARTVLGGILSTWGLLIGGQSSLQRTKFLRKEANIYEHCCASGYIKDVAYINNDDGYF